MQHEPVFVRAEFAAASRQGPVNRLGPSAGSRLNARLVAGIRFAKIGLFALVALAQAPLAGASDAPSVGRIKADQVCSNCHGLDGQGGSGGNSALSPILTAQSKEYLLARLAAYRSGQIEHAQMTFIAKMITEQDMQNVADWYSGLKISLAGNAGRADNELSPAALAGKTKAQQVCQHCHGIDGRSVPEGHAATVPYLSGQPRAYLVEKLRAYGSGKIDHPQMSPIARALSKQEIEDVSEWYSGIEVEVIDFE